MEEAEALSNAPEAFSKPWRTLSKGSETPPERSRTVPERSDTLRKGSEALPDTLKTLCGTSKMLRDALKTLDKASKTLRRSSEASQEALEALCGSSVGCSSSLGRTLLVVFGSTVVAQERGVPPSPLPRRRAATRATASAVIRSSSQARWKRTCLTYKPQGGDLSSIHRAHTSVGPGGASHGESERCLPEGPLRRQLIHQDKRPEPLIGHAYRPHLDAIMSVFSAANHREHIACRWASRARTCWTWCSHIPGGSWTLIHPD